MTLGYARYLYPADHQRPRAGTVGKRLAMALVEAQLVADMPHYGLNTIRLTPRGPLAALCEAAGLFNPSVQVTIYGDARTFTDPCADPASQTRSFCPDCDTAVPTKGHLQLYPRTGMMFCSAVEMCPCCEAPFDADSWPQTAEPVAFIAHLTVAVVADGYQDTHPSFGSHAPGLIRTVERVLDEPVTETVIAGTGGAQKRLFVSTVPGKHPARPSRTPVRRRFAWARQAQAISI
ncbi:MAG: hypothetical protein ACI9MR_001503 [Myxococcota bacterium]|jgi:hypothetical protein